MHSTHNIGIRIDFLSNGKIGLPNVSVKYSKFVEWNGLFAPIRRKTISMECISDAVATIAKLK